MCSTGVMCDDLTVGGGRGRVLGLGRGEALAWEEEGARLGRQDDAVRHARLRDLLIPLSDILLRVVCIHRHFGKVNHWLYLGRREVSFTDNPHKSQAV